MSEEKQSTGAPYGAAMSSSSSTQFESWTLQRAMDALVVSARAAGHPGWLWLAGMLYPTLTLGLDLGWDGLLTLSTKVENFQEKVGLDWGGVKEATSPLDLLWRSAQASPLFALGLIAFIPIVGLCMLPFFRIVAGLVRIAPPSAWNAACEGHRIPRLHTAWAAGKGMTRSMFALWIQVALMTSGALLALGLPAAGVLALADPGRGEPYQLRHVLLLAALIGPMLCLLVPYALALSVMNQLAMHSLAHNRRGVSSALLHAWRIMRNDPWATGRAILVDVILFVLMITAWRVLSGPIELVLGQSATGRVLAHAVQYLLIGIAGVTRAGYWARAYRALGGLSPDDGVPGLVVTTPASSSVLLLANAAGATSAAGATTPVPTGEAPSTGGAAGGIA